MILYCLRGAFIVLVAAVTALYLLTNQWGAGVHFEQFLIILIAALAVAGLVIVVDVGTREKKLAALSGVFLGLMAGLLAAYALSYLVNLTELLVPIPHDKRASFHELLEGVKVVIGLITCYLGISLVLQTKDEFRFILPYVEFAKQIRGNRPTVLDTSVIIDGRILDIVQTQVLQGGLIVPKFVLNEIQTIADSADKLRRQRGRRGLDILQKLQDLSEAEVSIDDSDVEGATVDQKLVVLAQQINSRVMTNDFNLAKIANLRGVDVINLNVVAKALRPVVLPGETMMVKIVKSGEGTSQGVGYLEDGTMVVVEEARSMMGCEVDLVVTSTLQTSAGRMIFGRYRGDGTDAAASLTTDSVSSIPDKPVGHEYGGSTRTESEAPRPKRLPPLGRNPRRSSQ